MSEKIYPPWDEETVNALNRFQSSDHSHPFTCLNDHGEEVALTATTNGWICPVENCDYTQRWVHSFMTKLVPPPTSEEKK